jgi:hypothetical protein
MSFLLSAQNSKWKLCPKLVQNVKEEQKMQPPPIVKTAAYEFIFF